MTSRSWISVMLAAPGRLKEAAVVKNDNFKRGIRSKESFKEYIRTPGSKNDPSESKWSWCNEDLLPTPPEKRSWGYWNYFCLYFSWSMDNWTLGSTMIGIGLNWWQSILVVFAGQLITSIFKAINSRCGAVYHIGYPIVSRSVFGIYGAYYVVFARAVVALVYYAIKVYIGSSFVVNMLTAVFGSHFTSIPNHISESTGFTTQQMLAFFLFWLIHIPFSLLRPNQLSWVFTVKMCTIPPAYIGLFIFCMVNTKGQMGAALPSSKTATSSQFSWFVMYGINAAIGNGGASITNAPDYARWSTTHWAVIWPNLIAGPLSVTISATFGILATSAINNVWGLELWNQWDLLSEIMLRYPRPDVRFAVFLCAAAQALLVLGTNIAANMIPIGLDCTMLFPRYINVIRGQILALFLVWAANPWKIVHSAATFTKFLSGYSLFMAAIVGPTTVEYYILTKGNIWIPELYSGKRSDNHHYWYTRGWNINAYIAYFAGIAIPFAGFLGTLGVKVSDTAADLGHLGWLLSYFVSAVVYFVCCKIWPTPAQRAVKAEALGWEKLASIYSEFGTTETLDGLSPDLESEAGETAQDGMKVVTKASSVVDIVTLRT